MASHTLAIAKASFAASLMRPDPTSIPRTEVADFNGHFDALLKQCSTTNIQLCKDWILKNITHSKTRTTALGKYLTATCKSLNEGSDDAESDGTRNKKPPLKRRQLHILYLLNDLLHHVEFHAESPSAKVTIVESLPSSVLEILQHSSAHSLQAFPSHHARIQDLLDIWAKQGYYPHTFIQKLRDAAVQAAKAKDEPEDAVDYPNGIDSASTQARRDAPYIMPPSHGDPSIPFYDIPAGNMIPLIIPNSTAPINPQSMKPLQFVTGPADPQLASIVDEFLKRVDALDVSNSPANEGQRYDIDELGQSIVRDIKSGEILESEGYYGWSRAFCEKMKKGEDIRGFGTDISREQSQSRSLSPRKRRRYSSSQSYSSVERQRSASRGGAGSSERRRYRSRSASRSRSPPTDPRLQERGLPPDHRPPPFSVQTQGPSPPPPPPFTQGFPLGPGGVPIPPRPAGYNGPWPPLPPQSIGPGGLATAPKPVGYNGPWPPIPPPPPSLGGIPTPPKPLGYNGPWPPPPPPPLGPRNDSNGPFAGQHTSPSNLSHSHPYDKPFHGQMQTPSHDDSHQQNTGNDYRRGGW